MYVEGVPTHQVARITEVLRGFEVASGTQANWRHFVGGLQAPGLYGVRLIASDKHIGLKAARR